jgi:tripartite ATP-independent transporter DctM subunit
MLYVLYVVVISIIYPEKAPAVPKEELIAFKEKDYVSKVIRAFILPLLLILSVLGSIFAGIASPTEAAAVGALMATILTAVEKRLNIQVLKEVMTETVHLTSMVFIILVGATAFGLVFRGIEGDDALIHFIKVTELSPYAFLAFVMVLVFFAGFFIDFIEIIFIFMPVVTPVFAAFQMDLLWIAILVSVNLQASFLTPPFGFSLFYLKGVTPPEIKTTQLYKGIIPFIIIQIILIAAVVAFPEMVTWLPQALRN